MKRSTLLGLLCFILFTSTAFAEDPPAAVQQPPAAGAPAGGAAGGEGGGGAPAGGAAGEPAAPAAGGRSRWEDDLDKLGGSDDEPPAAGAAPGGKPDDKKAKPGDRPSKPGEKPTKPGAPAAPAAAGGEGEDGVPQFTTNGELRKWAAEQRKAAKMAEDKITQLTQQVTTFEQQTKAAGNPVEMSRQLAAMKTQLEDYENRVRMIDYEQSAEYRDKYEKPYQTGWKRALTEVAELEVTIETGEKDEQGNAKTATRPAKKEDFQYIMGLPLGKAGIMASKLFKENGAIVMQHYNRIRDLRQNALDAIDEYKTKGKEFEEAKTARAQSESAAHNQLWKTTNERMATDPKRKEFWGKSEDPAEQAELEKGFAFADQLFGETYDKLGMEDKILLHAAIRHRVAGFHKLAHRNKTLRGEIATLNKTIEELRSSGPGKPGGGGGGTGGGTTKTWQEGIDALPE